MLKKSLITLLSLTLSSNLFAETCPSVSDLQNHQLHGWTLYDSDNGFPLSQEDADEFSKQVSQFTMAEYAEEAPEGSAHCYYLDNNNDYMFAFLAKHDLKPDNEKGHWQQESGFLRCHDYVNACAFTPS